MRVLGIDCGTERTGYGVIDSDGAAHLPVAWGVIETRARDPLEGRLLQIAVALREQIVKHGPEEIAVEQVFHSINAKSSLKLAHVRGVALLAAAESGLKLGEYSPLEVKTAVVGYGRAEKSQVQWMIRSLLRLDRDIESEDAADALAVAICHACKVFTLRRMGAGA